jgi:hypothetical protein
MTTFQVPSFLACRQGANTLDLRMSKVRLRLQTDTGKFISDERVHLLTPDGRTYTAITNDDGIAEFKDLYFASFRRCFVILPDILEAWQDGSEAPQLLLYPPPSTGGPSSPNVQRKPLNTHLDDLTEPLEFRRGWDKDLIDALVTGSARKPFYRAKDATKHVLYSRRNDSSHDDLPDLVTISGLTNSAKLLHFADAFATAVYTSPNEDETLKPYAQNPWNKKLGFQADTRHWTWGAGAVCNQFANIFLSYWFNYNAAFTPYIVSGSGNFLSQMDDFTSDLGTLDGHKRVRGFSNLGQLATTDDLCTDQHYPGHMRVSGNWDAATTRFSNTNLMTSLGFLNVYSVSDSKGSSHHGGMILQAPDPLDPTRHVDDGANLPLRKLAADGYYPIRCFAYPATGADKVFYYPYPTTTTAPIPPAPLPPNATTAQKHAHTVAMAQYNKQKQQYDIIVHYQQLTGSQELPPRLTGYSHEMKGYHRPDGPIAISTFDDPAKRDASFHIRIWSLKPLRPGGYAPGSSAGDYKPESEVYKPDSLDDFLPHALPRFVQWLGTVNVTLAEVSQFMAIPVPH